MTHIPGTAADGAANRPLHQNPQVLAYIRVRDHAFNGFVIRTEDTGIVLRVHDDDLIAALRAALPKYELATEDGAVLVDLTALLSHRSALQSVARERSWDGREMRSLLSILQVIHALAGPETQSRIERGEVIYDDLPVLFERGMAVICQTDSDPVGGLVESCAEQVTVFGNYTRIMVSMIVPTSKGVTVGKQAFNIAPFEGKLPIAKLAVRPLSEADRVKLTERGAVFRRFVTASSPASYSGELMVPSYWTGDQAYRADGRVIIDPVSFARMQPNQYRECMYAFSVNDDDDDNNPEHVTAIADADLWRCYYRVQGFSLALKRWGWLRVGGLSEVHWHEDAFNRLVLDAETKDTVLQLVKHYAGSFGDLIEGKSGGLVFLLHGPSGAGKTLTAEAVAEALHRPLYSVSVGELGVTPTELETKLRAILDLAFVWNAVLLIDEADIFMEARDTNNIVRNAMVSVFLRLLEYYPGVLFLTTNRVQSFDKAFFSRISLPIEYRPLALRERAQVWQSILAAAGQPAGDINPAELATFKVNGRNIKTAVRIAQTLAKSLGQPMCQQTLLGVLRRMERFNIERGL